MTRKPDQLDMAIRREVLTIRRQVTDARLAIRRWEPRPCPPTKRDGTNIDRPTSKRRPGKQMT